MQDSPANARLSFLFPHKSPATLSSVPRSIHFTDGLLPARPFPAQTTPQSFAKPSSNYPNIKHFYTPATLAHTAPAPPLQQNHPFTHFNCTSLQRIIHRDSSPHNKYHLIAQPATPQIPSTTTAQNNSGAKRQLYMPFYARILG